MKSLSEREKLSVLYHDIFDYPLHGSEIGKWRANLQSSIYNLQTVSNLQIVKHNGYYYLSGRKHLVRQRLKNEKASVEKLKIAERAAATIARVPMVKMVAISGSLAMNNASPQSDIDLLIVTAPNALWSARPLVYGILHLSGFVIRKPKDLDEKDKLCLNLWMDEQDLLIKERNIYTAHELAQLVPLVNKENVYEKLINENKWVGDYWPKAYQASNSNTQITNRFEYSQFKYLGIVCNLIFVLCNLPLYFVQRLYMRGKMTRENVSLTRAFFHPRDWGNEVEDKLKY